MRRLANGATPRVLGGKRGFSPGRGKRPAVSCDEELGSYGQILARSKFSFDER